MAYELTALSRDDVVALMPPIPGQLDLVEETYLAMARGDVELPPKPGIHPRPDAFIHAMPAYIPALHAIGVKWVSGYPENYKRALPYITGLLILNDTETGMPLAVMDCTWITAMRTGAATAVAVQAQSLQAAWCSSAPDTRSAALPPAAISCSLLESSRKRGGRRLSPCAAIRQPSMGIDASFPWPKLTRRL